MVWPVDDLGRAGELATVLSQVTHNTQEVVSEPHLWAVRVVSPFGCGVHGGGEDPPGGDRPVAGRGRSG
ncbi:hypothetical protein [Trueperella sp. LYQ141]|uniref:hypothetical protein n=1 Tax=Trueperella sp. LYQ141 TaxID=3391058 RepID=UPI003982EE35